MKYARAFRRMAAVLAAGLVISCGVEAPSAPPAPQADLIGGVLGGVDRLVGTLLTCTPQQFASATRTIGTEGGTINMGPHSLVIPAGALNKPTTITATVVSDTVNSVRFAPEGLKFKQPAALVMSYSNCNLVAGLLTPKRIAYTTDGLLILEWLPTFDNILARKVTGRLDHFSRYAIGW